MYNKTTKGQQGGVTVGKSHARGGMQTVIVDTGEGIEVESGEGILSRKTMTDSRKRNFEGRSLTPVEIASELNEKNGGNRLDGRTAKRAIEMEERFAKGGKINLYITNKKSGQKRLRQFSSKKDEDRFLKNSYIDYSWKFEHELNDEEKTQYPLSIPFMKKSTELKSGGSIVVNSHLDALVEELRVWKKKHHLRGNVYHTDKEIVLSLVDPKISEVEHLVAHLKTEMSIFYKSSSKTFKFIDLGVIMEVRETQYKRDTNRFIIRLKLNI
jgi:hypothetical protein